MSIQRKIFLIFVISLTMLLAVLFVLSHAFLLDKFAELEKRDIAQDILRFRDAFNNDRETLQQKLEDWANWDDTYRFAADGNAAYIKSNLADDTCKDLQLSVILYLTNTGRLVYGRIFDLQAGKEMPDSGGVKQLIAKRIFAAFMKKRPVNGVLVLPQGPLLLAATAILTSQKAGPSRGILVMGRFLDDAAIQRLAKITHLPVKIAKYAPRHPRFESLEPDPDRPDRIFIHPINNHQITAYTMIADLSQKPALIASITLPRRIYHQGQISLAYYKLTILATGIALIIVVLIFLKIVILDRLASFHRYISSIAASNDMTIRIPKDGNDELTGFAELINQMMDNLQLTYDNLTNIIEFLPDATLVIDQDHRVVAWNRAMEEMTSVLKQDIVGKGNYLYAIPFFGEARPILVDLVYSGETKIKQYDQYAERQGKVLFAEVFAPKLNQGNGAYLWAKASPLFDKSGAMLGAVQSIRDITKYKIAAEGLRRYRILSEQVHDIILFIEMEGKIIEANEAAVKAYGYTREELLKLSFFDLLKAGHMDGSQLEQANQTGLLFEDVHCRKDGSSFPVEVNMMGTDMGEKRVLMNIARDISDRKRAEAALRGNIIQLRGTLKSAINALSSAIEMRDPYTAGHQERVARFALAIAAEMGFSEEQKEAIQIAGSIHDIGKLAIPAEILSKPVKLSETEYALIKIHPQVGYTILSKIEFPWPIAEIVLQHHERLDGSGYPRGIAGNEILLEAKILCVADVVEAISSHRPYRPALGMDKALEEIVVNKGILYDPDVVEACQKLILEKKI